MLKKIILAIILTLILPIYTFLMENGILDSSSDVVNILNVVAGLCTFIGVGLLMWIVYNSVSFGKNETKRVWILGKPMGEDDLEILKDMTLKEKLTELNVLGIVIPIICFILIVLVCTDPLNLFSSFKILEGVQIYVVFILIIIGNTSYIKINGIYLSKIEKIYSIIMYIIAFIILYRLSTPFDNNMSVLTYNEFQKELSYQGYSVTKINELDKLNIKNSDIYLAEKESIKIYYIISKNRSTARRIYTSLDDSYLNGTCNSIGEEAAIKNYRKKGCENPNYFKVISQVKNTVIFGDTTTEHDDDLEKIIEKLGYSYYYN